MMFAPVAAPPELTRRQRQVLAMTARGDTAQQIADELDISGRTVEEYLLRLRTKFGARNTTHLCALAIAHGLIDGRRLRKAAAAARALGIS